MDNQKEQKKNWISRSLGLYRATPYVTEYEREANVRSTFYMSLIIILLEVSMIVRNIVKYVLTGKCTTVEMFFAYTKAYWLLLFVGVVTLLYSIRFVRGKIPPRRKSLSVLWITLFAGICLGFGMYVSTQDFRSGRMIICFLTMTLYVACLLIWRPYLSILLLTAIGYGYYCWLDVSSFDRDGNPLHMNAGDRINYITFFISLTMIAISIYHQRHREATKAESLELAAITDTLTGAPNMYKFQQTAAAYLQESQKTGTELIYLFFNIENFNTFNDRFGYAGGNELLTSMKDLICSNFPNEPYARQADDHFVVLTKADGCDLRIGSVRNSIKYRNKDEVYLDVKVGGYRPKDIHADPCLEVDHARYAAELLKNHPDDFFREFDEQLAKEYRLRQYVLNNIDRAIKNGYIKVYYQPLVWSNDGDLCGCEALARWDDPETGFLSPGDFVPILEECRQIHKLDRCVYEIVCQKMRECLDKGMPIFPISLNFSRLDFELMDAVGELEKLVEKYRIPREYLHVEITESALTDNEGGLQKSMKILREKGYALWLDDFGSGYSSMNVLKDYKFDLLKIDMVFLKNFTKNDKAHKIIKSILDLARDLDMMTLTEGVETQAAVDFLQGAGCGRLQGYFYGRPMTFEEIYAKIEDGTYRIAEHLI
ncbi:MAG: GGDEF domain-containing protein [Lachnospiraceae bacterium]|nr:GGDEF domain-containing protein [Lachnospiraceae bacterium]